MEKELLKLFREFRKDFPMTQPEHLTLDLFMGWLEDRARVY